MHSSSGGLRLGRHDGRYFVPDGHAGGASRVDLTTRRAEDMKAVRHAVRMGADADALLANTPLPPTFDLDRALELWKNGLDELAALALPVD